MKYSIITVNRNNSEGLEKTINSVINQNCNDFEFIIIDGASSDNSVEIIKQHIKNINYWVSEKDTGIYNAMNKGIQVANGDYCLFLNSGDYLCKQDILNELNKYKIEDDIVYFDFLVEKDNKIEEVRYKPLVTSFFYNASLNHQSILFKRKLFDMIGLYNENLTITADHAFLMEAIYKYNASIRHIPIFLSIFNLDGCSNDNSYRDSIQKQYESTFKSILPLFYEDYKYLYEIKYDSLMNMCIKYKDNRYFRFLLRIIRKIFVGNNKK